MIDEFMLEQFVDDLVIYEQERIIKPLIGDYPLKDEQDLFYVVIDLLDWFKLQHRRKIWALQGRPAINHGLTITLDDSDRSSILLKELILNEPRFHQLFIIEGESLALNEEIPKEEIAYVQKYACEHYNPPLFMF